MTNITKDIEYHNRVNCSFAEAVYQKMATERYGIEFCCETDLQRYKVEKELLDLNQLVHPNPTT